MQEMDLAAQADALKRRAQTARARQAAAEGQLKAAQDHLLKAQQGLVAEFPAVTSLEDARATLQRLEAEAAAEASKVSQALTAAGG